MKKTAILLLNLITINLFSSDYLNPKLAAFKKAVITRNITEVVRLGDAKTISEAFKDTTEPLILTCFLHEHVFKRNVSLARKFNREIEIGSQAIIEFKRIYPDHSGGPILEMFGMFVPAIVDGSGNILDKHGKPAKTTSFSD